MGAPLDKRSSQVRKSIDNHTFTNEDGDEYSASTFNGFGDYMRRKKIKLQNRDAQIRASASEKPQIFRGVVAHVSGYTQPPLHILHQQLVQHGAGFLQYLDGKTMATHIIASALTPKKQRELSRYRVVNPSWVLDSIAAGKLLSWTNYRVISEGARQRTLALGSTGDAADGKALLSLQVNKETGNVYKEMSSKGYHGSQFQKQPAFSPTVPQFQKPVSFKRGPNFDPVEDPDDHPRTKVPRTESTLDQGFSSFSIPDDIIDDEETKLQASQTPRRPITPTNPPLPSVPVAPISAPSPATPSKPFGPISPPRPRVPLPPNPTPEQYNAWLLSDPRYFKSSSANPDFLRQFYSESRLHHLSTWKADLKAKLQRLASSFSSSSSSSDPGSGPPKRHFPPGSRRYILHVDFDSFFCAVSLKSHPHLLHKPVVVAHSASTSSEIASCNYPARTFGVRNGMWMKTALELCSDLTVLPYNFPAYEVASEQFYTAVIATGGIVQSVSVDEVLVDATQLIYNTASTTGIGPGESDEQAAVETLAHNLRMKIKEQTDCHVSVGIAPNILLAKLALRRAKPAGQYLLRPSEIPEFLNLLEVRSLPGVAGSIAGKLADVGVTLVSDLQNLSKERLSGLLGPKTGERLWEYARGIDRSEVGMQPPRKSVSAEISWGIRFINQEQAEKFAMDLCKELERRLLNEQVKGTNLTVKIMRRSPNAPLEPVKHLGHGICDTFNKSAIFRVATNTADIIGKEAIAIIRAFNFSPGDIRGIGLQLTKLEPIKYNPAAPLGSQKTLDFSSDFSNKQKFDPIEDDFPVNPKVSTDQDLHDDPIADDPLPPKKSRFSRPAFALAHARQQDDKAVTPLNISGTQFMLPRNADPSVIAELPFNIRTRLLTHGTLQPLLHSPSHSGSSFATPIPTPIDAQLLQSQIDPEVFAALPDDMKAEIHTAYRRPLSPIQPSAALQTSPHRNRIQPSATTPTRRQNRAKARERLRDAERGLLQTTFSPAGQMTPFDPVASRATTVSLSRPRTEHMVPETDELEIDANVLAKLPEIVQQEVSAEQEQQQVLWRNAGDIAPRLAMTTGSPEASVSPDVSVSDIQPQEPSPTVTFPPHPPKIVFEMSGTTSETKVHEMIDNWISGTFTEGPHVDDVDVFGDYIGRVIYEEQAMDKAVRLVKWLDWKVGNLSSKPDAVKFAVQAWIAALKRVKEIVRRVSLARGLPPIHI